MSPKLKLLQRSVLQRPPEQAPAPEGHGLGAAIEQMIAEEVERRVGEAVERKPPPHVQRLLDQQFNRPPPVTDYRQLPPVPKTPAPKAMQATIQRDGAGLARAIVINGQRFLAQRDAAGQLIGMIGEDMASEVAYDAQPGMVPRKLYGNDPEV